MKSVGCILLLMLISVLDPAQGHGILRCPPGRSTMWRDGYPVPENYQDNQLNCGGLGVQWGRNGGKCGACGDPYDALIKENQPPYGIYAKGFLTGCYNSSTTRYIDSFIEITANHMGYIEFRICPHNNVKTPVSQECLDKNVLRIIDSNGKNRGTRYKLQRLERDVYLKIEIPEGMTCHQCVLQWRYYTGNSWGCEIRANRRRRCGIGYGEQETFHSCADLAILPDCDEVYVRGPKAGSECSKEQEVGSVAKEVQKIQRQGGIRPAVIKTGDKDPHFSNKNIGLSGIFAKALQFDSSKNRENEKRADKSKEKDNTDEKETPKKNENGSPDRKETPKKNENGSPDRKEIPKKNENGSPDRKETPKKNENGSPDRKETPKKNENGSPDRKESPKKDENGSRDRKENPKKNENGSPSSKETPKTKKVSSTSTETDDVIILSKLNCYAIGIWSNIRNMNNWCQINCKVGHCPPQMCACDM